jgi:hypothetical protein
MNLMKEHFTEQAVNFASYLVDYVPAHNNEQARCLASCLQTLRCSYRPSSLSTVTSHKCMTNNKTATDTTTIDKSMLERNLVS